MVAHPPVSNHQPKTVSVTNCRHAAAMALPAFTELSVRENLKSSKRWFNSVEEQGFLDGATDGTLLAKSLFLLMFFSSA